jgi:hypothetical protein
MQDAARLGRLGADQAAEAAETVEAPDELRAALGYWNEMIDIARHKTGKLIDESRNADPSIPWTEIGSALGISSDAARQRWHYYRDNER